MKCLLVRVRSQRGTHRVVFVTGMSRFLGSKNRCNFCYRDNRDWNSRLLQLDNDPYGDDTEGNKDHSRLHTDEEVSVVFNDDKDDIHHADADGINGDYSETIFTVQEPMVRVGETNDLGQDGIQAESHRQLRCSAGCFRLNGGVSGSNKKFTNTKYVGVSEYWNSAYAIKITGKKAGNNNCKDDGGKVRVYDTTQPGPSTNIGAPNKSCKPHAGPGVGAGGAPKLGNGKSNPFKNCPSSKTKTAFTLQGPGNGFSGCQQGFSITVQFRHPATINKIGLLDVVNNDSARVDVFLQDGTKMVFRAKDGGANSAQEMTFKGVRRAVKMIVTFKTSGGEYQYGRFKRRTHTHTHTHT